MQSLGEVLSNARTEKGYSIDQVAHETNISRNYIQDLEREAFDQFPAEAYLIGFLRNYSEYLGLEAEKMISLYKNHKLSEAPSPIEELVGKKKRSKPPIVPILIGVAALALIFLGIRLYPGIKARAEANRAARDQEQNLRPAELFTIEAENQELKILEGDTLRFTKNDMEVDFQLEDIDGSFRLTQMENATGESHQYLIRLQEELFISLFGDSPDYRLVLQDYGLSSGESLLLVEILEQTSEIERDEEELPTIEEIAPTISDQGQQEEVEAHVILTMPTAERFTLDIKFRGYSLYRYEADNRNRDERYYRDGDSFRLDVNRRIQLWLSNGGAAYAKINGQEVPLGEAGEVSVQLIQWVRNDQGSYDLVLLPVY